MPGHAMPGHGQPIFIAVPVYMPQGQGIGSPEGPVQAGAGGNASAAATQAAATQAQAQAATQAAAPPAAAAAPAAVAPSAAAAPEVASSRAAPVKPESSGLTTVGKEAWAMHPSIGFQSMMTLQMPQFVSQALSTEEGDEKPTHAVCA